MENNTTPIAEMQLDKQVVNAISTISNLLKSENSSDSRRALLTQAGINEEAILQKVAKSRPDVYESSRDVFPFGRISCDQTGRDVDPNSRTEVRIKVDQDFADHISHLQHKWAQLSTCLTTDIKRKDSFIRFSNLLSDSMCLGTLLSYLIETDDQKFGNSVIQHLTYEAYRRKEKGKSLICDLIYFSFSFPGSSMCLLDFLAGQEFSFGDKQPIFKCYKIIIDSKGIYWYGGSQLRDHPLLWVDELERSPIMDIDDLDR